MARASPVYAAAGVPHNAHADLALNAVALAEARARVRRASKRLAAARLRVEKASHLQCLEEEFAAAMDAVARLKRDRVVLEAVALAVVSPRDARA